MPVHIPPKPLPHSGRQRLAPPPPLCKSARSGLTAAMTPGEFIAKWSDTGLRERAGSHSHFIDLCRLLGEKPPTDADPRGECGTPSRRAP